MSIREIRILPPFAIARFGSAEEPVDNYSIADDPQRPLGFRRIIPEETLTINPKSGRIRHSRTPSTISFKHQGRIRPVAPFLELFAVVFGQKMLQPLHLALTVKEKKSAKIEWRVTVANRKVERRTGKKSDRVEAGTSWFFDHIPHVLEGRSRNFINTEAQHYIDFGHVQFIEPNEDFPEFRLRFTPAKGLIYGPNGVRANGLISARRAIYEKTKGWFGFGDKKVKNCPVCRKPVKNTGEYFPFCSERCQWADLEKQTLPPSLYAITPPAPPWLNDNVAVSRGYLDDTCDGFVEARLTLENGETFIGMARICAGPPALVPDSQFVRSLADDLEQVIHGPKVPAGEPAEVTRARAADIVRRAYETVRFMNVALMNGNNFKGRPALLLDSMPQEEAADTERAIRPVMTPGSVDTLAIMALHEQVYAALRGGAAPWFLELLRKPDEVADFTDFGRRKMPALMCGADNNYLALTHRQIDTIRKVSQTSLLDSNAADKHTHAGRSLQADAQKLQPRNRTAQLHYEAKGNPISSRPVTAVANCCPGLEVDFRAVWRRMFKGIVLREYDNLVVAIDPDLHDRKKRALKGHRLLRVRLENGRKFLMMTRIKGPASSDPNGEITLTSDDNPHGLAPLEWSNALAPILSRHQGKVVHCDFTRDKAEAQQELIEETRDHPANYISFKFQVRPFFDGDTAVISKALAEAGELTQGLCSPWQNDYRECSCYYWASARPDYINVEPGADGLSHGDNWLQKRRTGDYIPDDYTDTRLILYDDLFKNWEHWLRFQVGGRDVPDECPDRGSNAQPQSAPTAPPRQKG